MKYLYLAAAVIAAVIGILLGVQLFPHHERVMEKTAPVERTQTTLPGSIPSEVEGLKTRVENVETTLAVQGKKLDRLGNDIGEVKASVNKLAGALTDRPASPPVVSNPPTSTTTINPPYWGDFGMDPTTGMLVTIALVVILTLTALNTPAAYWKSRMIVWSAAVLVLLVLLSNYWGTLKSIVLRLAQELPIRLKTVGEELGLWPAPDWLTRLVEWAVEYRAVLIAALLLYLLYKLLGRFSARAQNVAGTGLVILAILGGLAWFWNSGVRPWWVAGSCDGSLRVIALTDEYQLINKGAKCNLAWDKDKPVYLKQGTDEYLIPAGPGGGESIRHATHWRCAHSTCTVGAIFTPRSN